MPGHCVQNFECLVFLRQACELKVAVTLSVQEFVMGIKEMPRLARFIPKIMLAITVTACDEVYRKIACWLNDMGETSPWKAELLFVWVCLFIH